MNYHKRSGQPLGFLHSTLVVTTRVGLNSFKMKHPLKERILTFGLWRSDLSNYDHQAWNVGPVSCRQKAGNNNITSSQLVTVWYSKSEDH